MMKPIHNVKVVAENSELGKLLIRDKLLHKDIWSFSDLGIPDEEASILQSRAIYFNKFQLPWLAQLAKATVLAKKIQKHSLSSIQSTARILRQLSEFLCETGCFETADLNGDLLRRFILKSDSGKEIRLSTINYSVNLWKEEGWVDFNYVSPKLPSREPKIETIPEEVLFQIYEQLHIFPLPLERLFRLQMALGARLGEMTRMPRNCLKKEGESWFMLRYIEKRKTYKYIRIHASVAEIVQVQQKFLVNVFGEDSDFPYLFSKLSLDRSNHTSDKKDGSIRFKVEPLYLPEILSNQMVWDWIRAFNIEVNLRDKYNKSFWLKNHMFRRTKASIMAYCETEDEYIAAVLGHSSLDMLSHYRKRSLEKLEKDPRRKGYVDKYGRFTTIKPKRTRYENLSEIMRTKEKQLKVTTPLGECHRPIMLGDCQYRYACFSCDHHRVTLDDKEKLEADKKALLLDRGEANEQGKIRKSNEISNLLELIENRLTGLNELANL